MHSADVVVIGAGIVGAFCADRLSAAGLRVTVVDRGSVAGGTTGSGEGNILVSDKEPGAELDLALLSNRLWRDTVADLADSIELEAKGGMVAAATTAGHTALRKFAEVQRAAGVDAIVLSPAEARELEPYLTPELEGAVLYPQDMQVQPAKAAAAVLRRARNRGARLLLDTPVTGFTRSADGRLTGVTTPAGRIATPAVVNAAGVASGQVAELAGAVLPVEPRRGFILVTEPLPPIVRRKVYDADYVANVASDDGTLQTSTVVEGTVGGTVLIGASRERVGFDPRFRVDVLGRLARQAIRLFPVLADVQAIRAYRGFRPFCPDHLPVIGPDPDVPGLVHATGHEGAGIGLAPATAALVEDLLTGRPPELDPAPYRLDRPTLVHARNALRRTVS
jgi:D-hydroxyproline dehydrogenase subunit beta